MTWRWNSFLVPLALSAVVSAGLAYLVWRRRHLRGARPFSVLMLAVTGWSLGYWLQLAAVGQGAKLLWSNLTFVGIVIVPAAWLLVAAEYANLGRWLEHRRRIVALLAIEPIVTLLLAWTNESHLLFRTSVSLDSSGPLPVLVSTFGVGFWLHTAYSYLLLLAGAMLLGYTLVRAPRSRLYRGQMLALMLSVLFPWLGNALHIFGPSPYLDLTPFAFALSGLAFAWGFFRFRLLEIIPAARNAVIENMGDGVIVLDANNRVVDINPTGEALLGQPASSVIGKPGGIVFAAYPALMEQFRNVTRAHTQISYGEGADLHTLDLRISPLRGRSGSLDGRLVMVRDVTEQVAAESQLRDSEEKYRTLFEASTDAILLGMPDGRLLDCNSAACEVFGYGKDELLTLNVASLAGAEGLAEAVRRRMTGGFAFFESTGRRRDGTIFPVEISARAIRVAGESLILAYFRDITSRRRADEAAQRRNRELALLNRVIEAANATLEPDMVLSVLCRELALAFGLPLALAALFNQRRQEANVVAEYRPDDSETLLGQVIAVAPDQALATIIQQRTPLVVAAAAQDRRLAAMRTVIVEQHIDSLLLLPLVVRSRVVGVVALAATKRRYFGRDEVGLAQSAAAAVAQVLENARLYSETVNKAHDLATLVSTSRALSTSLELNDVLFHLVQTLGGHFDAVYASVALTEDGGKTFLPAAAYSKQEAIIVPLNVPIYTSHTPALAHVARLREPFFIGDLEHSELVDLFTPQEKEMARQYGVRSTLIMPLYHQNELLGMVTLRMQQRMAELPAPELEWALAVADQAALAVRNAQLYFSVQRHANQLTDALARQEELDRMKSQFIQNISHELRTPLAIAQGYAELLKDGELGALSPRQQEPMEIISRRIVGLTKLVDQIVSILDMQRESFDADLVDMASVVQQALADFRTAADKEGLSLVVEVEPDLPPVVGDSHRLLQVLENLLDNARKFTPAGGSITVRLNAKGDQMVLEVEDTGIGIPPDQLDRVFDRFYQVDGSATRRYGGTGVGLAVVKEIVELHRGTVTVQSRPDLGSTFRIALPLRPV